MHVHYDAFYGDMNDGGCVFFCHFSELFSTNIGPDYQAIEYYMCEANSELHEGERVVRLRTCMFYNELHSLGTLNTYTGENSAY